MINNVLIDPFISNGPPTNINISSPVNGVTNFPLDGVFSWSSIDPDGDTLLYDIYLGTNSSPSLSMSGYTDTQLDISTMLLSYNTFYYWKVVARDILGQSVSTPIQTFVTAPSPLPEKPIGLQVTASELWNQIIWTQSSDGVTEQVIIERKNPDNTQWEVLSILSGTTSIFNDSFNIIPHSTYEYRIIFKNSTGQGEYSSIVAVQSYNEIPIVDHSNSVIFDAGKQNVLSTPVHNQDGDTLTWQIISP